MRRAAVIAVALAMAACGGGGRRRRRARDERRGRRPSHAAAPAGAGAAPDRLAPVRQREGLHVLDAGRPARPLRAHARRPAPAPSRRPTTPTRPRACSSTSPAGPGRAASPSSRARGRACARCCTTTAWSCSTSAARAPRRCAARRCSARWAPRTSPSRRPAPSRRARAPSARNRRFYSTADTVADLEALRVALGADKLTLDGVSYGTFVAERYAIAHPDRVARLVLDSVVPAAGLDGLEVDGMHETARVLRAVCRAQHCPGDPAADLAAVVRARHDGSPELDDTLVALSVGAPSFPGVLAALREARAGHPQQLERLVRVVRRAQRAPAPVLSQGLHAATLCADTRSPWGGAGAPLAGREAALRTRGGRHRPRALRPRDRRRQRLRAAVPALAAHAGAGGAAHGRPAAGADAAAGRRPRPLDAAAVGARAGGAHAARQARRRHAAPATRCSRGRPAARAGAPSSASCSARLAPCSRATRRMRGRRSSLALEEARALRSGAIGTGHLLLGVIRTLALLVPLQRRRRPRPPRRRRRPARGRGCPSPRPPSASLEAAPREAQRLGHGRVTPAHLLLALAAEPEAVELSSLDPARLRDEALRHLIHPPDRFDLERALREGGAVPVWLGDRELPIGDLGHPRVDARLLLAILGKAGTQRRAPARARSRRGGRPRCARRTVTAAGGVLRALCGKPSAMAQGPAGTLVDWLMACQQHPIDSSSRRFRPKR